MKPRTKFQKHIVALSKHSKGYYTAKSRNWIIKNELPKFGRGNKKEYICFECNHKWKNSTGVFEKEVKCPNCKAKLSVLKRLTQKSTSTVYQIPHYFSGYQIFYLYTVYKTSWPDKPPRIEFYKVSEKWIDVDTQKSVVIALARKPFANYHLICWDFAKGYEVRPNPETNNYVDCESVYPKGSFHPHFYRNGFDGELHQYNAHFLFNQLMYNPKSETLWKAGQYDVINYPYEVERHWKFLKICMKHKYIISDFNIWKDYVYMLSELRLNVHDPSLLCPENLKEAHDKYMKLLNEKRRREEIKRERERNKRHLEELKRNEKLLKSYDKRLKSFSGVIIKTKDYLISPIKTIKEFKQIAESQRHCIFTNAYYAKKGSLMLKAIHKESIAEVIEFSLDSFKVLQAYGAGNTITEHHNTIIKLIERKAPYIKRKINEHYKSNESVPG